MQKPRNMILAWMGIFICAVLFYQLLGSLGRRSASIREMYFSAVVKEVQLSNVVSVEISGHEVTGKFKDGSTFKTIMPNNYPDFFGMLAEHGVAYKIADTRVDPVISALISWLPMLLIMGLLFFMFRRMQGGAGGRLSNFGSSRAKLLTAQAKKITFNDVAGAEEAKEELQEIVEFLKAPQKFQKLGGRIPKGVLLVGPPGTGKTLLARAVAGEANTPFFSISGSDFVEMFVGVGASRVRDLFMQGRKNAPCIIFIDEIDAVGRHRGSGLGGGHDEREQTLNQLLVEMDGFDCTEGVILVAATNRKDVLDPALLRPGRFDREVSVTRPDVRGREGILKVHTKNVPMHKDVDLSVIARGTPGFSGADLANLVNEAALLAARYDHSFVSMADFESAKDKVLMGVERKSLVVSDAQRRTTAYHEAGHALLAMMLPGADPLHKVTIIPRGMALGVTMQLPEGDTYCHDRVFLEGRLTILMGGRIAEELFLEQMTTGASNDIERATETARRMVCLYGMSEELGLVTLGQNDHEIFLGKDISQRRNYSEETAVKIDREVRRLVMEGYERAKKLIDRNRDSLIKIAQALLLRETLDLSEVKLLIAGDIDPAEPA